MLKTTLHQPLPLLLIALSLSLFANAAAARDISNEQREAYEARQAYNKAKTNYADYAYQIEQQEKRVADAQTRLNNLQNEQANAQSDVDAKKADLDAKVQRLNDVWDERNK